MQVPEMRVGGWCPLGQHAHQFVYCIQPISQYIVFLMIAENADYSELSAIADY